MENEEKVPFPWDIAIGVLVFLVAFIYLNVRINMVEEKANSIVNMWTETNSNTIRTKVTIRYKDQSYVVFDRTDPK